MRELAFSHDLFSTLKTELLRSDLETAAVLFANVVTRSEAGHRFLVRKVEHVPLDAYRKRNDVAIELTPSFVAKVTKEALQQGQALIFVHTHPRFQAMPTFSPADDAGESLLKEFLGRRMPGTQHASLVLSDGGCRARLLGTNEPVRVALVGSLLQFPFDPTCIAVAEPAFDRQVRAFGKEGQARLRKLRVGIVGLGGTGTIVAEELAHLGVGELLLIDADVIETSNLNRLVGARNSDVGEAKVKVAARHINAIRDDIKVQTVVGSVLQATTARIVAEMDFFFICTDSNGSRAVLNQLAYQYLIPCIDTGISITARHDLITHITGRAQMLAPGLGCLTCAGYLDADAVRRDLMTDFERQADPYFIGVHEPQPAVISLNSTVVSLAVTMFLAAVTHIPADARYQIYNGITGTVRPVIHKPNPACIVCSPSGALARGDEWPLPARKS